MPYEAPTGLPWIDTFIANMKGAISVVCVPHGTSRKMFSLSLSFAMFLTADSGTPGVR
jgi:hypothetical protein